MSSEAYYALVYVAGAAIISNVLVVFRAGRWYQAQVSRMERLEMDVADLRRRAIARRKTGSTRPR